MVCLSSLRSCAVHRPHPPTLLWLCLCTCKSRAVISTSSLRHFSKQNSKISKIWCVKSIGSTGCSNLSGQSERPGREFFFSREPPHRDSLGRFNCPPSDQKTTFFSFFGGRKIEQLFHRKVQGIPILETLLTPTTSLASCHWLDLATIRI